MSKINLEICYVNVMVWYVLRRQNSVLFMNTYIRIIHISFITSINLIINCLQLHKFVVFNNRWWGQRCISNYRAYEGVLDNEPGFINHIHLFMVPRVLQTNCTALWHRLRVHNAQLVPSTIEHDAIAKLPNIKKNELWKLHEKKIILTAWLFKTDIEFCSWASAVSVKPDGILRSDDDIKTPNSSNLSRLLRFDATEFMLSIEQRMADSASLRKFELWGDCGRARFFGLQSQWLHSTSSAWRLGWRKRVAVNYGRKFHWKHLPFPVQERASKKILINTTNLSICINKN